MKTTKILFLTCLLALGLQGCDLDRTPADSIEYEESFRNMQDAKKWDNGIYSTLRGKLGGAYVLPQEVQADMLNAHATYGNLYSEFHGWKITTENNVLQELYHSYYAALTDANVVIERLPAVKASKEEQKAKDQYLGNAYFARAFYHFNLAMRWAKPYEEVSAKTTLGIPLALKPFILDKPTRATNKETYDQILKDLHLADSLLAHVPTKEGNEEISADAVKAFRARVYLYMGNMEKALDESKALIQKHVYTLIEPYQAKLNKEQKIDPREDAFAQMWFYDSGKEQIWQPHVAKENEIPTPTSLYGADLSTTTYWDEKNDEAMKGDYNKPKYIPTREVLNNLFAESSDHRALALFEFVKTTVNDMNNATSIYVVSKFKGNPNYATLNSKHWGGYVPNGNQAPKPFRIAEQYLIAAEASCALQQWDEALRFINELKTSRGISTIDVTGDELYKEIKAERARELAFEGFRLWDLRRWKEGITSRSHQGAEGYYNVPDLFYADGFKQNMNIKPDNFMFVWPFPKNEVSINNNLKQDKEWNN